MAFTAPAAGVMATKPATAPVATPTAPIFPVFRCDITPQVNAAVEAARLVTKKAFAAESLAATAEPALNPNHPSQRIAAPRTTYGTLLGCIPGFLRFPTRSAAATAAIPAFMWITVPPAKSRAPRSHSHPFTSVPSAKTLEAQTQCVMGA